jgi:hypothetical protein
MLHIDGKKWKEKSEYSWSQSVKGKYCLEIVQAAARRIGKLEAD